MDFQTLAIIFAALAAGAVVKGATGMGLPLIALPFLTTFLGLQHAVVLVLIPILVSNVWQVWRLRSEARAPELSFMPLFIGGGIVGVAVGTWGLTALPERVLVLSLGVILIGYVVLRLARPTLRVSLELAQRVGLPVGVAAGLLQGATGVSGPIGVTFIHWMGHERDRHVYAVSVLFLVLGLAQLPALAIAGVIQPQWLTEGVFALLPILLFMPLGTFLAKRLSRDAFDRLILAFLGLMGLKMLLGV